MHLNAEDAKHLEAAEGWLELGDHVSANEELDKVTPLLRAHPDVLEMRARVFADGKKWDGVMALAETLTDQLPNRLMGWLLLAQAEHELGDTESAYETLVSVAEQFADRSEVPYALAVFAALIGGYREAEDWLSRAFEVGGAKLKEKALADPAFKEFWQRR
jgi:tetratricopeptide (TPR) repeat protein